MPIGGVAGFQQALNALGLLVGQQNNRTRLIQGLPDVANTLVQEVEKGERESKEEEQSRATAALIEQTQNPTMLNQELGSRNLAQAPPAVQNLMLGNLLAGQRQTKARESSQVFQAGEATKGRELQTDLARESRLFRTSEREGRQDFQVDQADVGREFQTGEREARQDFEKELLGLQDQLATIRQQANLATQSGEAEKARTFRAQESQLERDVQEKRIQVEREKVEVLAPQMSPFTKEALAVNRAAQKQLMADIARLEAQGVKPVVDSLTGQSNVPDAAARAPGDALIKGKKAELQKLVKEHRTLLNSEGGGELDQIKSLLDEIRELKKGL